MNQNNNRAVRSRRPKLRYLAGLGAAIATLLVGCTDTTEPAQPAGSVAATTQAPLAPVEVAALEGLLVPVGEVNTIVGANALQVAWSGSGLNDHTSKYDVPECVSALSVGHRPLFDGSGWIAARGQRVEDDPLKHGGSQRVISFATQKAADAFMATAEQQWSACAGRRVVKTRNDGTPATWMLGELSNVNGYLTMTNVLEGGDGWTAQRVLTARNNVVIDVGLFSYDGSDEASRIAGDIAAKIPGVPQQSTSATHN